MHYSTVYTQNKGNKAKQRKNRFFGRKMEETSGSFIEGSTKMTAECAICARTKQMY